MSSEFDRELLVVVESHAVLPFDEELDVKRACFRVDGDYFAVGGLSMGDMVRINCEFARVIREAKHARVV